MTNLNLFNSITCFQKSYNIINNNLIKEIFDNEENLTNISEINVDHLIHLQNITNFSKIKFFEKHKSFQQEDMGGNNPLVERNIHFDKQLEVLRLVPSSLLNDLEKKRILLYAAWNQSKTTKKFPAYEFDNYIQQYRNYCSIIGVVFKNKNHYDSLLRFNHPKFSCNFLEKLFGKLAEFIKQEYKSACQTSQNIKVIKLDSFLIKDEQYKEILYNIKNDFNLNQHYNINNAIENDNTFDHNFGILKKSDQDFQQNLINDVIKSTQRTLSNNFYDQNILFKNYNTKLLISTISYFFSFYLLKSKHYIENFHESIKKIVRCKDKISDLTNLYWMFNKQSNDINLKNSSEISQILFNMIQYIIERDLINGQINGHDVEEIWSQGMQHYFGNEIEIKPEHILQNHHWSLGKFCNPAFNAVSLVNSSMIFDQYSIKNLDKKYDKNTIQKFLNGINISNIDYQANAMIDETMSNVDIFKKYSEQRFAYSVKHP
jgi:Zn-dependent M32 family carboxypeptidase